MSRRDTISNFAAGSPLSSLHPVVPDRYATVVAQPQQYNLSDPRRAVWFCAHIGLVVKSHGCARATIRHDFGTVFVQLARTVSRRLRYCCTWIIAFRRRRKRQFISLTTRLSKHLRLFFSTIPCESVRVHHVHGTNTLVRYYRCYCYYRRLRCLLRPKRPPIREENRK